MLALLLIAMAAADPPPAPSSPLKGLDKVVTDAIRNCPGAEQGAVVVCARDRGFAEGYRLPKLKSPKPPPTSGPVISVVAGPGQGTGGGCSDALAVGTLSCGSGAEDAQAAWQREQARRQKAGAGK